MPMLKYKDPSDGLWKPVPVGSSGLDQATADGRYVNVPGDTMTGNLGLPLPTAMNHSSRMADSIPIHATIAARDGAYSGVGGPKEGMRCYVTDQQRMYLYQNGTWVWRYFAQMDHPGGNMAVGDTSLTWQNIYPASNGSTLVPSDTYGFRPSRPGLFDVHFWGWVQNSNPGLCYATIKFYKETSAQWAHQTSVASGASIEFATSDNFFAAAGEQIRFVMNVYGAPMNISRQMVWIHSIPA